MVLRSARELLERTQAHNLLQKLHQEVETVIPELVVANAYNLTQNVEDEDGNTEPELVEYMGIDYNQLIPIILAGMKQQQNQINELKELVNKLIEDKGDNDAT